MQKVLDQALYSALCHWEWDTFRYTEAWSPMRPKGLFSNIAIAYDGGPGTISMPWLCFFAFMTGVGGCAAFAGSIKTCETHFVGLCREKLTFPAALNWPDHRGTATAFPLSAFGLSAFFFASISSLAFPDNTQVLLLLLAIATSTIPFVGSFLLRVVPIPQSYDPLPGSPERSGSDSSTLLQRSKSGDSRHSVRRLSHEPGMQPESIKFHEDASKEPSSFNQHNPSSHGTEENSSLLSKSSGSYPGDVPFEGDEVKGATDHDSHHVDIRGLAMLSHMKFYLLWSLLGLLTGLGLMTINNIGSDVSLHPPFSCWPVLLIRLDRLEQYGIITTTVPRQDSYKNDN